jgi:hypothetical protein
MVVFRSSEGKPGYHQADRLDDAVTFVERLRNQESITEARIFRMEEVPIEFKTYYRVEVGAGPAADDDVRPQAADGTSGADGEGGSEPAAAASSGRFGRFKT